MVLYALPCVFALSFLRVWPQHAGSVWIKIVQLDFGGMVLALTAEISTHSSAALRHSSPSSPIAHEPIAALSLSQLPYLQKRNRIFNITQRAQHIFKCHGEQGARFAATPHRASASSAWNTAATPAVTSSSALRREARAVLCLLAMLRIAVSKILLPVCHHAV